MEASTLEKMRRKVILEAAFFCLCVYIAVTLLRVFTFCASLVVLLVVVFLLLGCISGKI